MTKRDTYNENEAAVNHITAWLEAHKSNTLTGLFEALLQFATENDIKDFVTEFQLRSDLHVIKTNGLNEVYELESFLERLKTQYGNNEAQQLCLC